jgi:hypothetical protein
MLIRQYLVDSFNHILCHIEQMHVDEISGVSYDKMDWQPENPIAVPIHNQYR